MPNRNAITKLEILVIIVIVIFLLLTLLPPTTFPHDDRPCRNSLRKISEAMLAYHKDYGEFPPAVVCDADEKPLYGWRVLLLPYVGEEKLYEKFNLAEPWDSPQNLGLLKECPELYRCSARYQGEKGIGFCSYVMLLDPDIVPDDDPEYRAIFITETCAEIPWTSPTDLTFAAIDDGVQFCEREEKPASGISSSHRLEWAQGFVAESNGNSKYFMLRANEKPENLREKLRQTFDLFTKSKADPESSQESITP